MRQDEIDTNPACAPSRLRRGRPLSCRRPGHRALYIFNHFEYDSDTLKQEYEPRRRLGTPINVPLNYNPMTTPRCPP